MFQRTDRHEIPRGGPVIPSLQSCGFDPVSVPKLRHCPTRSSIQAASRVRHTQRAAGWNVISMPAVRGIHPTQFGHTTWSGDPDSARSVCRKSRRPNGASLRLWWHPIGLLYRPLRRANRAVPSHPTIPYHPPGLVRPPVALHLHQLLPGHTASSTTTPHSHHHPYRRPAEASLDQTPAGSFFPTSLILTTTVCSGPRETLTSPPAAVTADSSGVSPTKKP